MAIGGATLPFYRKTVLPNGLRVVTEEMAHVRSVAVGVWVGAGSRHEPPEQAGISHFIEHMLFKGTETRTARDIAEAIDALGGNVNAFTAKECTCYYARVLDEHFVPALDLLADLVLRPRFDAGEMEKEKNVICEEIMMYEDSPEDLVHDVFAQSVWPDHALGRAIQGTLDAVRGLGRDDVRAYYERFYAPANMVVAVAGHVGHDRAVEEVARRFGGRGGAAPEVSALPPRAASRRMYREKDIEQVHICLGGEGVPLSDERVYALHLLSNLIGGGSSSRLFQEIREERGLAYSVYAFHNAYRDAGLAGVYLAASPAAARQSLELALAELERVQTRGVDEAELHRNKEQVKAGMLLALEGTGSRMNHLGKSELLKGFVLKPEEVIARLEGVTVDDVQRLAREIWDVGRLGLAAVGPAGVDLAI